MFGTDSGAGVPAFRVRLKKKEKRNCENSATNWFDGPSPNTNLTFGVGSSESKAKLSRIGGLVLRENV